MEMHRSLAKQDEFTQMLTDLHTPWHHFMTDDQLLLFAFCLESLHFQLSEIICCIYWLSRFDPYHFYSTF
jgi:hypothetical protein